MTQYGEYNLLIFSQRRFRFLLLSFFRFWFIFLRLFRFLRRYRFLDGFFCARFEGAEDGRRCVRCSSLLHHLARDDFSTDRLCVCISNRLQDWTVYPQTVSQTIRLHHRLWWVSQQQRQVKNRKAPSQFGLRLKRNRVIFFHVKNLGMRIRPFAKLKGRFTRWFFVWKSLLELRSHSIVFVCHSLDECVCKCIRESE